MPRYGRNNPDVAIQRIIYANISLFAGISFFICLFICIYFYFWNFICIYLFELLELFAHLAASRGQELWDRVSLETFAKTTSRASRGASRGSRGTTIPTIRTNKYK